MTSSTCRVEADGLGRSYPGVEALVDVSLQVGPGAVLGILGHNGAGKSTLVDILCTRTLPSTGSARVCGWDVVKQGQQVRRHIGVISQSVALDEAISGRANLVLLGRLLGASHSAARARAEQMLEQFGLTDAADRTPGTYSGGMRRRLDLAASLLGQPDVLFLDEPTTGLDPVAKSEVWAFVGALAAAGTAIVLTTQDLDEAEQLSTDVLVLGQGRVVAAGTPAQLKAGAGRRTATIQIGSATDCARGADELARHDVSAQCVGDGLVVTLGGPGDIAEAMRLLLALGLPVLDLSVHEPTLVDVYLDLYRQPAVARTAEPAQQPATPAAAKV